MGAQQFIKNCRGGTPWPPASYLHSVVYLRERVATEGHPYNKFLKATFSRKTGFKTTVFTVFPGL